MADDAGRGFRFRDTTRAPFETDVGLRFDRESGTLTAKSADISMEGMFIKTDEPRTIGTLVQFEFSHGGETVQGLGDVVWVRQEKQPPNKPRGMGIQFRYVDPHSRELIYRIVSDFLRRVSQDTAAHEDELGDAESSPAVAPQGAAVSDPSSDVTVLEDMGALEFKQTQTSDEGSIPDVVSEEQADLSLLGGDGGAEEAALESTPSPLRAPSEQATVMVPSASELLSEAVGPAASPSDRGLPELDLDSTVLSPTGVGGLDSELLGPTSDGSSDSLGESPETSGVADDPVRSTHSPGSTAAAGLPEPSAADEPSAPMPSALSDFELPEPVPVEDPVHQESLREEQPSSSAGGFGSAAASSAKREFLRPLVLLLLLAGLAGALYFNRARLFPQFFSPSSEDGSAATVERGDAGAGDGGVSETEAEGDGAGRDGAGGQPSDEGAAVDTSDAAVGGPAAVATTTSDAPSSTRGPESGSSDGAAREPQPSYDGGVASEDTPPVATASVGRITRTQVTERESSTEIRIFLDRSVATSDLGVISLSSPPRFVVKISGVTTPYTFRDGGERFERARTGLHTTDSGPELHIVFDLISESIEAGADVEDGQVVVSLQDI